MIRFFIFFLASLFFTCSSIGQGYKVNTDQADAFSQALVKLMNSGINNFSDCKGDLLRSTSLEGDEYRLTIFFPESDAGVVRYRDWSKTAYVEFGNYADTKSLETAMLELVGKIKGVLGKQANVTHELLRGPESKFFISSIGIKDDSGYFSPNIELMSGSLPESRLTRAVMTNRMDPNKDGYYILMKIEGGIPDYFHRVTTIPPLDIKLNQTLQFLLKQAASDFVMWDSLVGSGAHVDKLMMNNYRIIPNLSGQNYSASLRIPESDSAGATGTWASTRQAICAAVGSKYVYYISEEWQIVFFADRADSTSPVVYLSKDQNSHTIVVEVRSNHPHEVSRGIKLRE